MAEEEIVRIRRKWCIMLWRRQVLDHGRSKCSLATTRMSYCEKSDQKILQWYVTVLLRRD